MYKKVFLFLLISLLGVGVYAQGIATNSLDTLTDVQKYYRAIHVMAMLLLGFGFLMVFVRKYGRSALTATFLLVSVGIPVYMWIKGLGLFGGSESEINTLILAEFATASLLITSGAILGRIKMYQYIILGILFIPAYMLNEWIMLDGGFGLVSKGSFIDTGGSIVIHSFGALFGIAAGISLTTKEQMSIPIDSDFTSDRFSLLGSMLLWVFWPSFCAALVPPELVVHTAINVVLALSGATLATYVSTVSFRGKIDAADIANASLAGGVAIGAVSDTASFTAAIIVGILAGILSVAGFAFIQEKLQKGLKLIDTCGVSNLHGMPGIFGGLAALVIVPNLNIGIELEGIGLTIVIALVAGWLTGLIVSAFGRHGKPYEDVEEFTIEE
jgi:ammonium transporter Rh